MTSSNDPTSSLAYAASRGWVSLRQFANIIGVSYPTACRMRDRGEVSVVKCGGIYRIYTSELRRFMSEGNLSTGFPETSEGEKSPSTSSEDKS